MTELRRTVLDLLVAADRPLTAYQLLDRLRAVWPGAAPPTIYRTLEYLQGQRLVHKLESSNAFVACTEPGQHANYVQLLVCGRCGGVVELEDVAVGQALAQAAGGVGFRVSARPVEIDGVCAACVAAA